MMRPTMLTLFCVLVAYSCGLALVNAADSETELQFGEKPRPGFLLLLGDEPSPEGIARKVRNVKDRHPLQGKIVIPAKHFVALFLLDDREDSEESPLDLAFLDKFQPDQIYLLNIRSAAVSGKELKRLKEHVALRTLVIGPLSHMDDDALAVLKELDNLQDLQVFGPAVDGKTRELFGDWESSQGGLRILELGSTETNDNDLLDIAKANPKLEILTLAKTKVTDEGLRHLASLKHLEFLDLTATHINGEGLKHLADLPNLRELRLNKTEVTDDALEPLHHIRTLQKVGLDYTKITDAALEHLAPLQQLEKVSLEFTRVTGEGFKHLAGLNSLKELYLQGSPVDDGGLKQLPPLESVELIHLDSTDVSDAGVKHLKTLKGLETILMNDTRVTSSGASFLKEHFPRANLQVAPRRPSKRQ